VIRVEVDDDGRLDQWPDGFFDQWDKALSALLWPKTAAE
jgi:predicted ATPase